MSNIVKDIEDVMKKIQLSQTNTFYFYPPINCEKVSEIPKQLGLCSCCIKKCKNI